MKSVIKKFNKEAAFTIVELLVVMSIIMILMGILLPAFNKAKRYARKVRQTSQFKGIDVGLELYRSDFEGYPPSDGEDAGTDNDYPGAMKLAEAMMGQDLLGIHPSSLFNKEGKDSAGNDLYFNCNRPPKPPTLPYIENMRLRRGPYLNLENANPYSLLDLYGAGNFGQVGGPTCDPNRGIVLCDEYKRIRSTTTGKRLGSPILYYKADVSSTLFDYSSDDNARKSIYNYRDNLQLIDVGIAWDLAFAHPIASNGMTHDNLSPEWQKFYEIIRNEKVGVTPRPKMTDTYILISAGYDGLYGTRDDIFNFGD
ncbi:MAG: prepilin-type N-terminal cleavage/methylation domain-containing protein [Planctomycetota bacterium]|jgi:type II secretory pathway pseudopilin PulG